MSTVPRPRRLVAKYFSTALLVRNVSRQARDAAAGQQSPAE